MINIRLDIEVDAEDLVHIVGNETAKKLMKYAVKQMEQEVYELLSQNIVKIIDVPIAVRNVKVID